jgi:hypothetical protein
LVGGSRLRRCIGDAAIFARAIRLNEVLRSHLLRDAVKDVTLARVLGNGATAGTWGAGPTGVILAVCSTTLAPAGAAVHHG